MFWVKTQKCALPASDFSQWLVKWWAVGSCQNIIMKNIIAFFLLSLTVACAERKATTSIEPTTPVLKVSMYETPLIDREAAFNHPYDLAIEVEKTADGQYGLITTMKLLGGSFYVSPHSTRDFTGKFTIEIAPNDNLKMGPDFKETPRSKEVIDPHQFVDGPVNWVKEDTRYEHRLNVLSNEDFEIGGKVIFTIEPKCTLEEIPLMFKYKSGVLTVEKWKC